MQIKPSFLLFRGGSLPPPILVLFFFNKMSQTGNWSFWKDYHSALEKKKKPSFCCSWLLCFRNLPFGKISVASYLTRYLLLPCAKITPNLNIFKFSGKHFRGLFCVRPAVVFFAMIVSWGCSYCTGWLVIWLVLLRSSLAGLGWNFPRVISKASL